jgi:erythromycin esterase-like protein
VVLVLPHGVEGAIRPLSGATDDDDPIVERAAATRLALVGGASHGAGEFYRQRAEITKRLIAELGFGAVAVEGDWPDADRVNLFAPLSGDEDA